ncbi:hypothetical protein DFH07DRAFT_778707 [Mycena maculata]|uniref:Uncharacterized protein n=1 Tax=Mycena maculata TaxID=230809 RepID=A0AAD7MZM4_9AGAR|nr:hypothetical protein DFH07DRAFT_778707 [Mycena maculata]
MPGGARARVRGTGGVGAVGIGVVPIVWWREQHQCHRAAEWTSSTCTIHRNQPEVPEQQILGADEQNRVVGLRAEENRPVEGGGRIESEAVRPASEEDVDGGRKSHPCNGKVGRRTKMKTEYERKAEKSSRSVGVWRAQGHQAQRAGSVNRGFVRKEVLEVLGWTGIRVNIGGRLVRRLRERHPYPFALMEILRLNVTQVLKMLGIVKTAATTKQRN